MARPYEITPGELHDAIPQKYGDVQSGRVMLQLTGPPIMEVMINPRASSGG
jgi:hypothetical protein